MIQNLVGQRFPNRVIANRRFGASIAALITVAALSGTAEGDQFDSLRTELQSLIAEHHVPGLSIAIVQDGDVVFAEGFGVADLKTKAPATDDTIFAIGSTTKAMTAAVMGTLVDEGKLSWDDPVTQHLPYLKLPITGDQTGPVVIADLLAHRTGFTRMSMLWLADDLPREDMLRQAITAESWAPFRDTFLYNNVMYIAAGEIAAAAGGSSWAELVTERLFTPLDMSRSFVDMERALAADNVATGYVWDADTESHLDRPMRLLDRAGACGGVASTVRDMSTWITCALQRGVYNDQRLLSEEAWQTMWTAFMPIGPDVDYGLGWMIMDYNGRKMIAHDGSIDGFGANVGLFPDDQVGYVVLANLPAVPFANELPSLVLNALDAGGDSDDTENVAVQVDAADERLVGEYLSSLPSVRGDRVRVFIRNDRLAVDIPGQTIFELNPPDDAGLRAFANGLPISVSFEDDGDEVAGLTIHQAGMTFEMPRVGYTIQPEIPLDELTPLLGAYSYDDNALVNVLVQNNRLAVDIPGEMVYELHVPDNEGWRTFRAIDAVSIRFSQAEADGSIKAVLRSPRGETEFMRIAGVNESLPSVEDVMAMRADSVAALERLGAFRATGTMRFAHAGVGGHLTRTVAPDLRMRDDADFGRFGWYRQVIGRDRTSVVTANTPTEVLRNERFMQSQSGHPLILFGDWSTYFDEITLLGMQRVEDVDGVQLRLAKDGVPDVTVIVHPQTGDLLSMRVDLIEPLLGTLPVVTRFSDYREINGARMPFVWSVSNEMMGRIDTTFDSVEPIASMDDALFQPDEDA